MSKKNNIIAGGLNGLLNPNASEPQPVQAQEPETAETKTANTTVCYSIPVDVAEKIRYIAYYDRKKLGAVVAEALAAYIEAWKPATEKPKKL